MYCDLVFPLSFRKSFSYSIPEDLENTIQFGVRAVAPFGKRILTGFVISISNSTNVERQIKDILDVVDENPIFDAITLKFYEWLAEYYLCSLGEVLKFAVPYGTEIQSKKTIYTDKDICKKLFDDERNKSSIKAKILSELSKTEFISLQSLQKKVGRKNIYSAIRNLKLQGIITIEEKIAEPKVKAKRAKFLKLEKSLDEIYEFIPEIERKSPKQVLLLLKLISFRKDEFRLIDILKEKEISISSINSLAKKGILKIFEKEIERKFIEAYTEDKADISLTEQQKKIIDEVSNQIDKDEFKPFLLYGVTGSGKTQVYIELIKKILQLNKTALVLVPEISLTPQITSRLKNNFGSTVSILHSRMSLGERFDSWQKILKGNSKVVIGARSALFAPLKNIGLIVADEEHDASYKQDDMIPKYNARDSSVMKAKFCNCPIILGSATPSIESMFNAKTNKYRLIELPERVDDAKLPKITLVNVIEEKKKNRMENIFSKTLLEKIDERLQKKEAVIILQNRRGFATQIYCVECGQIETCINCSVSMVFHINANYLKCHYCGLIKNVPPACNNCGSIHLIYFGTGTQRVEDELEYYFPSASVARIDSDAISGKGTLGKILFKFKNGEIDILIGTQMVAKGLDFSRVTLVGVISAETNLWFPDFRADERTFQLLTQVAGRAGRSKAEGEVLIQTQNDKHFVLNKILMNDYFGFYEKEIKDRERLGYPPFSKICLIETKDKSEEKSKSAIVEFFNELQPFKKQLKILPPSTAIISKLKEDFRFQILIKSLRIKDPSGFILRKAVSEAFINFNRKAKFKDVRLTIDIDPQTII